MPPCRNCEAPKPCKRSACVHWIEFREKVDAAAKKKYADAPTVEYLTEQKRKAQERRRKH